MEMITNFFKIDNYVYMMEGLTILAILVLLGYFFYIFNVFKKG